MKTRNLIFNAFFLGIISIGAAQSEMKTNSTANIDVVVVYEQVVKEGYGSAMIYEKLANEYYFKNDYVKAKKWFEKLFETKKPQEETLLFRYTQTLKALKLDKQPNEYLSITHFDDH